MTTQAQIILKEIFGFSEFRGQQANIILHVVEGGDCLVLMPTGGGKSLCYQIPALIRDGVAIVVSPLIALMENQVAALKELGVRAAFLNSSLSANESLVVEQAMLAGTYDLIYVAPERLLTQRFQTLLQRASLALFAIDEAHCVSQWGHDFRPEYSQLSLLHRKFPQVPRIALTASADDKTRSDIIHCLGLQQSPAFISSFDRPNLYYRITEGPNSRMRLLDFIRQEHPSDSGIIYCRSRKKVEETATWLNTQGVTALPYHAGMDTAIRSQHQKNFLYGDRIVMVATTAFGLGIDKPDVRFVAHLDLPKSIEGYYQETGRAGRDGLAADAWMTYGHGDVTKSRRLLDLNSTPAHIKQAALNRLNALLGLCETTTCRRVYLLQYFGEMPDYSVCGHCDICRESLPARDMTISAQKALSCVYRTGQCFGVEYLVDVLLGKLTTRIKQWNHDKISTFGIGQELDAAGWRTIFRHLLALGFLDVNDERDTLRLTQAARGILRDQHKVILRFQPGRRLIKDKKTAHSVHFTPPEQQLWEALRHWRQTVAKDHGVPAYVVFHDTTLLELIRLRPQSSHALQQISGMGTTKLSRYGDALLDILRATDS
ncbi:MAG: DNA helicase RecQ [Nitrosomonas sp.]|nr:DNA helicase RecQ [Nitrosomonas sp.]